MRNHSIPRVEEIAALGDGTWQLRWFGTVQRNALVPTEPDMQVLFRLCNSEKGEVNASATPTFRVAHIGVGQFPFLTMGSRWKDGHVIADSGPDELEFDAVIDAS